VYGPRERPDKAIQKFLTAARKGAPIEVLGDGTQRRDFTYVGDVVEATVTALERPPVGENVNVARGRTVALADVIATIRRVTGKPLPVVVSGREAGDVRVTSARIEKAERLLDFVPQVDLETGIRRQWVHVQEDPGLA
jgi:nucleoside-diphosphate-sugar epimerase